MRAGPPAGPSRRGQRFRASRCATGRRSRRRGAAAARDFESRDARPGRRSRRRGAAAARNFDRGHAANIPRPRREPPGRGTPPRTAQHHFVSQLECLLYYSAAGPSDFRLWAPVGRTAHARNARLLGTPGRPCCCCRRRPAFRPRARASAGFKNARLAPASVPYQLRSLYQQRIPHPFQHTGYTLLTCATP